MWDDEDDLGYFEDELIGDDWDELDDEIDDALEGYGDEIIGDDDDDDDYFGDDDYEDDDLDEDIGARRRRRRRPRSRGRSRRRRPVRRRRTRARPSGKMVRRVKNRQLRRYPLGLGATVIGAGATAIISANPQLPFRVNRLVVAVNVGSAGLLIDNLQVGTVSQFVAAGSVPIDVFAPDAVSVSLKGDTAVPGVNVQITISNPTVGPLTFAGAIIGTVAQ